MRLLRGLLILAGLAIGVRGALLLLDLGWDNLVATVLWLAGGVAVHDGVIGPAVVLIALIGARVLRRPIPGAVVIGAVVLGTTTVVAVPVLGSFGAREDNATLLDRNYLLGWVGFALLVVIGTVIMTALALRRGAASSPAKAEVMAESVLSAHDAAQKGGDDGEGTGGR